MFKSIRMILTFLVVVVLAGFPAAQAQAQSSLKPQQAQIGGPDAYGYTLQSDTTPFVDISTTGAEITFTSEDGYQDASIGFVSGFPFYENTLYDVYVSANGFLSFEAPPVATEGKPMTVDAPPNNLIAVFWDDLIFQSDGKVYTLTKDGCTYGRCMIVQWKNVYRYNGNNEPLTFEVILHQNGNIVMAYQTLSGDLTQSSIGIKDADGFAGLQYLYHSSSLTQGTAVMFERPTAGGHLKTLPRYQSGMVTENYVDFPILVKNTGNNGASDVYQVAASVLAADSNTGSWNTAFYQADGTTPLVDSDGIGGLDTGTVAAGNSVQIITRVTPPEGASSGAYLSEEVVFTSKNNAKTSSAKFQAAVPSSFAQVYYNVDYSIQDEPTIRFELVSPGYALDKPVINYYTGQTMTMTNLADGRFLIAWERWGNLNNKSFTNLEYSFTGYSSVMMSPLVIAENSDQLYSTLDRSPSVAAVGSGRSAVLYEHLAENASKAVNSNIYLAVLNSSGSKVTLENGAANPLNLTNNTGYWVKTNTTVPKFSEPNLVQAPYSRFAAAWVKQYFTSTGEYATQDVYLSLVDNRGNIILSPTCLTASTPGGYQYINPSVVALPNGQFFVTYRMLATDGTSQVAYTIRAADGSAVFPQTVFAGTNGDGLDMVRMNNGNVVLSWADLTSGHINYAVVNSLTGNVVHAPANLPTPNERTGVDASITTDPLGNAVLTWMDADYNKYLYYAVVNANGEVVTPPMVYLISESDTPKQLTSGNGGGVAYYDPFIHQYVPLVIR